LVVIGIGNVLLGDDGVGVRVIERLRALAGRDPEGVPAGTTFVDGGALIIDAADLGGLAGAVTVRRGARALASDTDRKAADGTVPPEGVAGLLGTAQLLGVLPGALSVIGVGVGDIQPGVGLSDRVAAALPRAVSAARRELLALDARAASSAATAAGGLHLAGATA
jgi:hydrogenase maturation protease